MLDERADLTTSKEQVVIFDGAAIGDQELPEVDVCIVGSGPAGAAVAERLSDHGRRVLVLESGPMNPAPWAAELNSGEDPGDVGFTFDAGRCRAVGGGNALWWGQCVRLEDTDFMARSWVPHSGWPIGPRDLADHYEAAEAWYGIEKRATADELDRRLGRRPAFADSVDFDKRVTVFSRRKNRTRRLVELCRRSSTVHLMHSATVTGLQSVDGQVTAATVRSPGGRRRSVNARSFVLAGGGVENARLLLVADRAAGGGSEFDSNNLVGRYLQEHPSFFAARVVDVPDARLQHEFGLRYRASHRYWPKLALSDATQEAEETMGATVALVTRFGADSGVRALKELVGQVRSRRLGPDTAGLLSRVVRDGRTVLPQFSARVRGFAPAHPTRATTLVQVQFEQAPDPQNRVTLGDGVDAFGVPVPRVHLSVGAQEKHTLKVITDRLGRELRIRELGRLDDHLDGLVEPHEQWALASHHAGTTRMSDSPRTGVVDGQCRVHGLLNLHVAGSSVFPTSGWGNPTLTIVALALRLGDEVSRRLDSMPPVVGSS